MRLEKLPTKGKLIKQEYKKDCTMDTMVLKSKVVEWDEDDMEQILDEVK